VVSTSSTDDGHSTDELTVRALSSDTWDAFADLAERHNGVFGGCWCTWFHTMSAEKTRTVEGNRALKERLVREGKAHAALVFDGDVAIGWCEYGSCAELPNIYHRQQYDAEADLRPDYRITCIFVDKRYRRRGVSALALRGAVELIADAGGGIVEGYPHDPESRRVAVLYNGTRSQFEREGFELVRRKGQRNTVMRRTVAPASKARRRA
jgi:GNAT superfamily N-acetyltransferase